MAAAGFLEEESRVPNIKSAIKRVKVAEKKRMRNRPIRSAVRTYIRTAERQIGTSNAETSRLAVLRAVRALDKAASKGVVHKNNAARRKSRLMRKLNRALAEVAQG
jgi:small subunit ribosomal protein S20